MTFNSLRIFGWGLLLCCLLPLTVGAQQLPLFSLYRENQGLINPASLNSDFLLYHENYRLSVGVTHRSQWVGAAGKTATQTVRGEFIGIGESRFAPLAGLYLVNDQVGPTSFTGFYGRLASIYGLEHPIFGGFSVGLNFGLVQYRIKASEIDLLDPDDILGLTDQSQWHPDVGVGVYYYKSVEVRGVESALVYAGLSAAQIVALDLTFESEDGVFPYTRSPHFYALAGAYKFLDEFSFLEFSTWTRFVRNAPLDVDINVRYQRGQKFWIGAGGAISGKLHAEIGAYLLNLLEKGSGGNRPLLKLSAGFDYALVNYHDQIDRSFEVNLAVMPRWGR